ncbi:MAG: C4-type zinc ribbon domain-containing protein [Endomicrobium sp.]|jgi:predicted  nucleic acid-binding Zn-ribbon protein|nr:C4-type zinc ribbon domain-containing protein [Endomicrobium sp.]
MDNLRPELKLLYELQSYDVKISDIREKIGKAPSLVEEKKKSLEYKKVETETKKKNFVKLNSLKKEKEAVFDSKEKAISVHSAELNSVKSNDVYKAVLLKIEKTESDKSVIENEILEFMDKIEKESVIVKSAENELKKFEKTVKNEINEFENFIKKLEKEVTAVEKEREEYKLKISKTILMEYERLRAGRDGRGICLIDDESCGGCGMMLRPQLINQVYKCHELVFCDNCSRILLQK